MAPAHLWKNGHPPPTYLLRDCPLKIARAVPTWIKVLYNRYLRALAFATPLFQPGSQPHQAQLEAVSLMDRCHIESGMTCLSEVRSPWA